MFSDSHPDDPRGNLEESLRFIRERLEPPVPELIAQVVLDARARGVRASLSEIDVTERVQGGQVHEVYTVSTLIIGNCLEPADRDAPEIVPELEAMIAALDPHRQ